MQVQNNFENNTFKVYINDDLCVATNMDSNVFVEKKVGLVITGYSSMRAPMKLEIHEISPYKLSLSEIPNHKTFHYNVDNFLNHLDMYDSDHSKKNSLSNIMFMQQKNVNVINDIEKLLKLMATRQESMEQGLEEELKKDKGGNFITGD